MTSTRLPGKVMKPVLGTPLLEYMIDRLQHMELIHDIMIATTTNREDDVIVELARKKGVGIFRGSEMDVMGRVLAAARSCNADLIVETTADCPLIDPVESAKVVECYLSGNYDYVSNIMTRTYPRGMDTQVFSTDLLEKVSRLTTHPADREHVAFYIYQRPREYKLANIAAPKHLMDPQLRLTVDTPEDFALIEAIIEGVWPENSEPSLHEMLQYLKKNPHLRQLNENIQQKTVNY